MKDLKKNLKPIIRGALFAVVCTVVAILLLAIILKLTDLKDSVIKPINQIIKVISIFVGVLVLIRNMGSNGLFYGAILGAIYTIFVFTTFSIFSGLFLLGSTNFVTDLVFGTVIGAISGIICVNFLTKRRI